MNRPLPVRAWPRVWTEDARRHARRTERLIKFGIVGASGTALNTAVFWLLTSVLHAHYIVAGAVAFETALCSNYVLNNNWTFADRRTRFISPSGLARYNLISLGGLLINLAVLQLLVSVLHIRPIVANLAGIAAATAWNFVLSTYWAWRPRTPAPHAPPLRAYLAFQDGPLQDP